MDTMSGTGTPRQGGLFTLQPNRDHGNLTPTDEIPLPSGVRIIMIVLIGEKRDVLKEPEDDIAEMTKKERED